MSLVFKEGTPLLPLEAKHKVKMCNGNIQYNITWIGNIAKTIRSSTFLLQKLFH